MLVRNRIRDAIVSGCVTRVVDAAIMCRSNGL
jgi:hypothetical protein